jgi:hypothetical protein
VREDTEARKTVEAAGNSARPWAARVPGPQSNVPGRLPVDLLFSTGTWPMDSPRPGGPCSTNRTNARIPQIQKS